MRKLRFEVWALRMFQPTDLWVQATSATPSAPPARVSPTLPPLASLVQHVTKPAASGVAPEGDNGESVTSSNDISLFRRQITQTSLFSLTRF